MKIGVIGAGNIGAALAKKLVALGHSVSIANSRGPDTIADVAKDTGARAVTVQDAVKGVELVIVTIPQKNVPSLAADLFRDVPKDVVVIDTGKYCPSFRDGLLEAIENGATESGWVETSIGRPVVKVFNNISSHSLDGGGLPKGAAGRIALPIAGDDATAKQLVMGLVDALGFDALDSKSIADSWRQQPATPVYCTDLEAPLVRKTLSMADRAQAPTKREESFEEDVRAPEGHHVERAPRARSRGAGRAYFLAQCGARSSVFRILFAPLFGRASARSSIAFGTL